MSQSKLKLVKGQLPASFAVTAHDLMSGDVVYLAIQGYWVLDIKQASRFAAESVASAIAYHSQAACADKIAGAYVIALDKTGWPLSTKEQLRISGPSNYDHHKYQGPMLAASSGS